MASFRRAKDLPFITALDLSPEFTLYYIARNQPLLPAPANFPQLSDITGLNGGAQCKRYFHVNSL